jgi:hypothetical protein
MLWVRISIRARCTTLCDKVCQWLATGQWFSQGTPVSSINKTDRHDITEILLKVALNTNKQTTYINKMEKPISSVPNKKVNLIFFLNWQKVIVISRIALTATNRFIQTYGRCLIRNWNCLSLASPCVISNFFFVRCVLLISVFCICVFCSVRLRSLSGPGWLNELGSWIT